MYKHSQKISCLHKHLSINDGFRYSHNKVCGVLVKMLVKFERYFIVCRWPQHGETHGYGHEKRRQDDQHKQEPSEEPLLYL